MEQKRPYVEREVRMGTSNQEYIPQASWQKFVCGPCPTEPTSSHRTAFDELHHVTLSWKGIKLLTLSPQILQYLLEWLAY